MGKESKNKNFVQKYDEVRELIRVFSLFGCLSLEDLKNHNIVNSDSNYNQLKRKIKAYFDEKHLVQNKNELENGSKDDTSVSILRDIYEDDYNYFCRTYSMKNLVGSIIRIYIIYMQLLSSEDLSITDISSKASILEEFNSADTSNHSKRLKKLCEMGYLKIEKEKNKYKYSVNDNIFDSELFNSNEIINESFLIRFLDFVSLMRNKVQPYVCGNMLLETALTYFDNCNAASIMNYSSPFFVKDGHYEQVLDDEVMYSLINAMSLEKKVKFEYSGQSYSNIIPIKVITNVQSGLRYLFARIEDENRYTFFSLDKIYSLEHEGKEHVYEYPKMDSEYRERTKYSFNGVTCLNDTEEPVELTLKVLLLKNKKKKNKYIKEVKALFPYISTEKEDGTDYVTARVTVNTVNEILPWLRKNMNHVQLMNSDIIDNELNEWRKLYGII